MPILCGNEIVLVEVRQQIQTRPRTSPRAPCARPIIPRAPITLAVPGADLFRIAPVSHVIRSDSKPMLDRGTRDTYNAIIY